MNNEDTTVNDLASTLKVVLADTMTMFIKTWGAHWNVEGPNFYEYHKMFGKIYEELFTAVDDVAEHIRSLDVYCPATYARFTELTTVEDDAKIPSASVIVERVLAANDCVIASLNKAVEQAKIANDEALISFLGARLEAHNKHGWFLRATTKKNRA